MTVVLPASIWAQIPKLRVLCSRSIFRSWPVGLRVAVIGNVLVSSFVEQRRPAYQGGLLLRVGPRRSAGARPDTCCINRALRQRTCENG